MTACTPVSSCAYVHDYQVLFCIELSTVYHTYVCQFLLFGVHPFTVFKTSCGIHLFPAVEVTISNLTLASRTATTLNVTWSAGYPKCYSFTVSHSTQDDSITVTQPADSDTSHTLTSLQPGTTYRIEVEAVRKGDGADGQRAKVIGNFTTEGEGEGIYRICNFH